jgi:[NiFe] hydrogenase assembly HybE family chaperone
VTHPEPVERLLDYYRHASRGMQGVPVYHRALTVAGVGFRVHEGRAVGVILTPWFMNLTVLPAPADAGSWRKGGVVRLQFPSGPYDFVVSEAGDVGLIATCSLFSLMHDFADQAAAQAAALAAAEALFEPEPSPTPAQPASAPVMSRRRFLRGG